MEAYLTRENARIAFTHFRKMREMSQVQMAVAMYVSPAYLSQIENGHRALSTKIWKKFVHLLGVTNAELGAIQDQIDKARQHIDAQHLSPEAYSVFVKAIGRCADASMSDVIVAALTDILP